MLAMDADNAIAQYNKALELNPDNVTARHKLGCLVYQVKGQSDEAMTHLLKAYELGAQDARRARGPVQKADRGFQVDCGFQISDCGLSVRGLHRIRG
jgi:tetratricopeptide (TPR) repeat protein